MFVCYKFLSRIIVSNSPSEFVNLLLDDPIRFAGIPSIIFNYYLLHTEMRQKAKGGGGDPSMPLILML